MPVRLNPNRPKRFRARYRIRNWPQYEAGLKCRGDLTLWLDEAAIAGWHAARRTTPGGQALYSDLAIELVLTLRLVFHLALRQAEGFARSVLRLLGLDLPVPDHTTLSRRSHGFANRRPQPERVVAFYNQRGTSEQWIKAGKNAVKWTRLSCRSMQANAVRLQLHALAYNLANFFRTLALPDEVERWSLTTLREKVVKIGAKVIAHARYTVFQMAEVAVPRYLFRRMLALIDDLRSRPVARC